MYGIVACETLYHEVEALAPDAAVRYVPHELHESPINVGDDREVSTAVQEAVADLDARGVSSIRIAYAGTTGLEGVQTDSAPLAVSLADDCVSQYLYQADTSETGEVKAPSTYYLTRGIIDRAPDSYKLYLAFQGRSDELQERFEAEAAAHPDLVIDWQESYLFERAHERGARMSEATIDSFFEKLLGYYTTVVLLDTGGLYDIHRWYGRAVRDFLSALADTAGQERAIEFRVADGDRGLLQTLFAEPDHPQASPHIATYEPGEPVVDE